MKRSFLENLFKDLEMEDSTKSSIIQSILDENDNDLNNEKAKTEGVKNDLKVMDTSACTLCEQNNIPIVVFDFAAKGSLNKIINGEKVGTFVN